MKIFLNVLQVTFATAIAVIVVVVVVAAMRTCGNMLNSLP